MRKVLILYPGLPNLRCEYFKRYRWRLRLAGIQLLLAADDLTAADGALFYGALDLPSAERPGEAWPVLRRFLDAERPDAIVAQSESALLLGAKAAEHCGLPGPSVEAAWRTASKLETRRVLQAAGVDQPRFGLVRDARELRSFARGEPVVLKAIASSRQRLVTPVLDASESERAMALLQQGAPRSNDVRRLVDFAELHGIELDYDPCQDFLVESMATGKALECDGVLSGTQVKSMGVCEQVMSAEQAFFIEGYVLPAGISPQASEEVEACTRQAIAAIGLRDTGYSIEYRMGAAGLQLIEVNGRLGWDQGFGEMFQAAMGWFPAALAVRVALGKAIGDLRPKRCAAVVYRSCYLNGRVEQVPNSDELRLASQAGIRCSSLVQPGEMLLDAAQAESQPHVLMALARGGRLPLGITQRVNGECARELYERALGALESLPFKLGSVPGLERQPEPTLGAASVIPRPQPIAGHAKPTSARGGAASATPGAT